MDHLQEVLKTTFSLIDFQFELNGDKNMFTCRSEEIRVSPEVVEFAFRYREEIMCLFASRSESGEQTALRLLSDHMSNCMERKLAEVNQFVALSHEEKKELQTIYLNHLESFGEVLRAAGRERLRREMGSAMAQHFFSLRTFLHSIQSNSLFGELRRSAYLYKIPCQEYTPELQVHVLGFDINELQEPVLDIGSGKDGGLVELLRQQGCDAYGIDKYCENTGFLLRVDWLDCSFQPNHWGTVVSHMAFSNHFTHHHLRSDGQPATYAKKFMEILRSIKISGSFHYAPGLPFIESLSPSGQFVVKKKTTPGPGMELPFSIGNQYATQVLKIRGG